MKHLTLTVLMLLLLALLPVQAQDDLDEQTFLLTFVPNIQFSPLYVAMSGGYFAEEGLELSVEYLNEPDVVDLIAAGREQFGMVSGEQVILAAAQGREVVYIYEWFQEYPIGVIADAERDITSAADLAGLRVGVPGRFGASYSGLTTLLNAAGLDESDITLDEIGFNAPEVFCLGVLDATTVYLNNEPLQILARAAQNDCGDLQDLHVIPVSEVADLVSNGIVTSAAFSDANPERVQAVVRAFDQGLQATINNPARAYLLSAEHVENLPLPDDLRAALEEAAAEQDAFLAEEPEREAIAASREALGQTLHEAFDAATLIQFDVLLNSIDLWDAEQLGATDPASWQAMQDTLLTMGILEAADPLEPLYTNAFLPR